jgi:hypothetical protein
MNVLLQARPKRDRASLNVREVKLSALELGEAWS